MNTPIATVVPITTLTGRFRDSLRCVSHLNKSPPSRDSPNPIMGHQVSCFQLIGVVRLLPARGRYASGIRMAAPTSGKCEVASVVAVAARVSLFCDRACLTEFLHDHEGCLPLHNFSDVVSGDLVARG